MPKSKWNSRTRDDLIIEVWEALDCESVGARELEQIQQALRQKFGEGALESPASIARTVANEGAILRHPEVFECDLRWRGKHLAQTSLPGDLSFASLLSAVESFAKLEEKRLEFHARGNETGAKQLREFVIGARKDAQLRARSRIIDKDERKQATEISQWLTVWLQAPELFRDWLDLRRRSPEFCKLFPEKTREKS
ncbi:MAG: hypothetical protein M3R69_07285 [Acidobacteriota bacterium]|nr:hypothetical protein [Acidobacteriota bacterium]